MRVAVRLAYAHPHFLVYMTTIWTATLIVHLAITAWEAWFS